MTQRLRFEELEGNVPTLPGIYEIYTLEGEALKVGIGGSLLQRLKVHRASRQSCLKLKANGNWSNPDDVRSKGSILTKHLYYDSSLTRNYDLTTEVGRRSFIQEQCYLIYETTASRAEAERIEKIREGGGNFRYIGDVRKR